MVVYFLRHGTAKDRSSWKGDDAARPLTDEGANQMKRSAKTMAALNLALDAIITSPLARASQTAEIVGDRMRVTPVEDPRLAPGFNDERLRAILLEHPDANAIMVVGHEPDFSKTISALIGGGRIVCKKGGLALVELPNAKSRSGELVWLLPPKVLAR